MQPPFPIMSPLLSSLYWIFIAWLFCIRTSPRCSAFCVCRHLRGMALVVVGCVFVFLALLCFCDKPYPLLLTFLPSHTCDKRRRLSMRPTDLNKFFQCLCFVNPHYTSCSITCSFSRYSLHSISSLQCVFFFSFFSFLLFAFPLGHIYRTLRMYAYSPTIDVYTSALSAISTASAYLFIRSPDFVAPRGFCGGN